MSASALENLKESLERQIITVLDFLFTDPQINEDQVINISKDVLKTIDISKNKLELYGSFYKLIRTYPVLESHLKNTLKGLKISYGS